MLHMANNSVTPRTSTRVPSGILEGEARERLILWINRRMAEFGITIDALARSLENDRGREAEVLYRDASGNTWNGIAPLPDWLRRATAAGQSIEHFRCD
jgi:DNA-binding protein H-NS